MKRIFILIIFYFIISFCNTYAVDIINEGFENSAPPAIGWTQNSTVHSINNPRSGPRSLAFNGSGDYVITPLLVNPDSLSFWYKRSSNTTAWSVSIEILNTSNVVIATLTSITSASTTYANYYADLSSYTNIKIKITDTRSSGAHERYIDDFRVTEISSPADLYLSRTETDTLSYLVGTGPSTIDTFRVWGDTLSPASGNIGIKASTNFEISTSAGGPFSDSLTLSYTSATLASTIIYFRLKSGLSYGYYTGTVTSSGGDASNKIINLYGKVTATSCFDLIISEYVIGSGTNKYLEIYNPTASTIVLNSGGTNYYRIAYFPGGTSSATAINFSNGASIPAYGTYVIGNNTIYPGRDQSYGFAFSGDDALSLQRDFIGTWNDIDVIGEIGFDPGTSWNVGGFSTAATTLVRKPTVVKGSPSSSGFPTLGTEWIAYPINENHNLGTHTNTCATPNITLVENLSATSVCPGESMTVDFSTIGTFNAGNIFTAQLSDSNGFFTTPTNIGTFPLTGNNPTGTINVTIPIAPTVSSSYHIRIISSNPVSGTIISQQELSVMSGNPLTVSSPSSTQESDATTLSWTNPAVGCWEQSMVVLSTNPSFTFTPTGDGSDYTANSVYASGTQVVYKDAGSAVNITGLTNGTVYYVKIFTRYGTNWSAAVEYDFLVDAHCLPKYTGVCDEYISNVTLNTINNSTLEGCGYNGYSWYADQTTDLIIGNTYTIDVQVGIVGATNNESYANDDISIWIDWNGDGNFANTIVSKERIANVMNNGAAGSYTFTVPANAVTDYIRIRVQLKYNGAINDNSCRTNFDKGETEDYTVRIIEACTTTISNFSFFPLSGSENTEVRISSTIAPSNFSTVTDVLFNGVSASSFNLVDENTIFAIVPEGAGNGRITLVEGTTCRRVSAGANSLFTYLIKDGSCNSYSDLFISEVQDPASGNNHYIEIYNGTNQTIDLNTPDNYSIQVVNLPVNVSNNINITGSILPGEVLVYYAGNNGGLATGTQSTPAVGFNEEDEIRLLKNGTILDIYVAPNSERYNYRRKPDAIAPSSTYDDIDWTSHVTSTSNIGTFIPSEQLKITTQPISQDGCEINMNVAATGVGTITYQWYYNDNRNIVAIQARAWSALINGTTQFSNVTISGATSQNLIITGDLGQLSNYQFYCIVTNGSCSEYSNAAQFIARPEPYFRSKQSGEWRQASSWEMSSTGSDPWLDACTFPWDTNSVFVEIRNGHYIDIVEVSTNTPDVRIDQLRILAGGQLKIESTAELHLNNGPGTDLFVQGTLYDQGSSSGGNGVTFLDTAKWILDPYGTIIKTGTSSVLDYKDNYVGGISTVPATANWIYRKETTVTPTIVTNDMFYPNLYFEDTYTGGALYFCTGNVDFMTIKGSLFVGDTGKFVNVSNNNNYTIPMRVLGNVKVGAGSTYRIASSPIGTGIEIAGNINNEGIFDINHLSSGLLRLNGNTDQSIGGTGIFDIWNMELDKAAQTQVILDTNFDVKNQLKFVGGIVNTQSYTLNLTNGSPTDAIVGHETPNSTGIYSDDKYVIGKLRRNIGSPNDVYVFPIGDEVSGMGYNPSSLTIRAIPGGVPFAIGEFVPDWPGTINTFRTLYCTPSTALRFIDYKGFACDSYWKYEGSNFSNYDIYLHPNIKNTNLRPNDSTGFGHRKNYRALKEVSSKAGLVWDPEVSILGDPCIVSDSYYSIIGSGYSGFSIFSPGGGDGSTTALPVQLLYFDLDCISNLPVLNWATASELNSDYFTLEKSSDGIHFQTITHINAAGNSNQKIQYSYTVSVNDIDNYFRLVQTDFDGTQYYHGIRSQECKNSYNNTYVYYQPFVGISAQFNANQIPISIEVFDAAGRLMSSERIDKNSNKHSVISSTNWAKGVYFVRMLYSNNEITTEKVAIY